MKNIYKTFPISILIISLFLSACTILDTEESAKPNTNTVKPIIEEPVVEEVVEEPIVEELTALEQCEAKENKYNLIVNAPDDSKIRILNIKPKYEDCIALKKGKYHIEVTKKGYMKHKEWLQVNDNMEVDISLIEMLNETHQKNIKKRRENTKFKEAGYNLEKLEAIVNKNSNPQISKKAKARIIIIKNEFKNYSPHDLIVSKGCTGFYPKSLAQQMLNIEAPLKYWNSIKWSGACKNDLMFGRGVFYFKSAEGLEVELKGKMKNGFFDGRVYNFSHSEKRPSLIHGTGSGYYRLKLKIYEDFEEYQR